MVHWIIVGAYLILFAPLLVGEALYWGLPSLQFVPWRDYAVETLRAGVLPLWNPYNGLGAPLFANYQSALLYPLNWPTFLLSGATAIAWGMSVLVVLHLAIGAWGMWRFTGRVAGVSSVGRGIAAIAYGLCGYLVARAGTYPVVTAAAWLPWLLEATHQAMSGERRGRAGARAAIVTALLLLAGHAQTAWYTLLLAGAYAGFRALFEAPPTSIRGRAARLAILAGGVLLGAAIAAAQLIPTAELLGTSQRGAGVEEYFAFNFSYAPARLLNLISPNVFGTPGDGSYYTQGAYFEDAVYVGMIPLASALAAILSLVRRGGQRRAIAFWTIISVIGLVFAFGYHTGIYPFLYFNVPTFDLFQAPARWLLWTTVGLCVLAAYGTSIVGRWMRARRAIGRVRLALVGAIAASLAFSAISLTSGGVVTILTRSLAITAAIAAVGLLVVVRQTKPGASRGVWRLTLFTVAAADLVITAWGLNPTIESDFFARVENVNTVNFLSQPPAYLARAEEDRLRYGETFRFNDYRVSPEQLSTARSRRLATLNLLDRAPSFNQFDPLLIGHYAAVSGRLAALERAGDDEGARRLLNALTLGGAGAIVTAEVCFQSDEAAVWAAMEAGASSIQIIGEDACEPTAQTAGRVQVEPTFGAGGTTIDYALTWPDDAPADKTWWLIAARTTYPGWIASVDGAPIAIARANVMLMAVPITAGAQGVRLEYRPAWLPIAPLLSVGALIVWMGWMVWARLTPTPSGGGEKEKAKDAHIARSGSEESFARVSREGGADVSAERSTAS